MIEEKNISSSYKEDIIYLNRWKNDEETFMFLGGGLCQHQLTYKKMA